MLRRRLAAESTARVTAEQRVSQVLHACFSILIVIFITATSDSVNNRRAWGAQVSSETHAATW